MYFKAVNAVGGLASTTDWDTYYGVNNKADTATYSWTFGDQGSGSGTTTSHSYSTVGTYTVTLTVNDAATYYNDTARTDTVTVEVIDVDLDIDGVPEESEETVGGVVVRNYDNNGAPRKPIILQNARANWTGNLVITRSSTKVKVYDASTGGTEITFNGTDNKFSNQVLPKTLYVEGYTASSTMRDVSLELYAEDASDVKDTVKFTVLWVTVTTDHSSTVNDDNAFQNTYRDMIVPPPIDDPTLGHHLFSSENIYGWNGRGSEFLGTCAPSDFVPSQFSGALDWKRTRGDWARYYLDGDDLYDSGSGGEEEITAQSCDLDPQSGGSNGAIYNVDVPGPGIEWGAAANTIWRARQNFEQWVTYNDTRCSLKKQWYARQSYKKTGSEDSGTASSAASTTLTDTSKNWATDAWSPGLIAITSGTGWGQVRRITGNTATTITIATAWESTPDGTSQYSVINSSTWIQENSVSGDNSSADGTTNTTWNLQ